MNQYELLVVFLNKNTKIFYFYFAGKGVTSYFNLKWWILGIEDEDEEAPLTAARRTFFKFFAQDGGPNPSSDAQDGGSIPSNDAQDGRQNPSNQFGRGQPVSSISSGWKPKPWKLLGGSGKNSRKGPTTKTQGSQDGNLIIF